MQSAVRPGVCAQWLYVPPGAPARRCRSGPEWSAPREKGCASIGAGPGSSHGPATGSSKVGDRMDAHALRFASHPLQRKGSSGDRAHRCHTLGSRCAHGHDTHRRWPGRRTGRSPAWAHHPSSGTSRWVDDGPDPTPHPDGPMGDRRSRRVPNRGCAGIDPSGGAGRRAIRWSHRPGLAPISAGPGRCWLPFRHAAPDSGADGQCAYSPRRAAPIGGAVRRSQLGGLHPDHHTCSITRRQRVVGRS